MGQAPLDLPDPLHAKPLASAGAADDLLSQMAGEEIDRLLAQAEQGSDAAVDDNETADREAGETRFLADSKEPGKPAVEPAPSPNPPAVSSPNPPAVSLSNPPAVSSSNPSKAPPQGPVGERHETAVSSFVAEGDPTLEAELDTLLATLHSAPVVPTEGKRAPTAEPEAPAVGAPAPQPQAAALMDTAAPSAKADPVLTGELDRVFDKMTAATEPAPSTDSTSSPQADSTSSPQADSTSSPQADSTSSPQADSASSPQAGSASSPHAGSGQAPTIDNPASDEPAKPVGSIDLLKVLDPIIAEDAAKAKAKAAGPTSSDGTLDEDAPAADRVPIYVLILEWVNAPLARLPSAVRDAAGKIGILTLINAAAVLLYVLFFRRK